MACFLGASCGGYALKQNYFQASVTTTTGTVPTADILVGGLQMLIDPVVGVEKMGIQPSATFNSVGSDISECGFEYDLGTATATSTTMKKISYAKSPEFLDSCKSLTMAEVTPPVGSYKIRSYAVNAAGRSESAWAAFSIPVDPSAAVETNDAKDISSVSVTLSGKNAFGKISFNPSQGQYNKGFYYGIDKVNPARTDTMDPQENVFSATSRIAEGNFRSFITGLTPATIYYYQAYAYGDDNVEYKGAWKSFTTNGAGVPTVETFGHRDISNASFVGMGEIKSIGDSGLIARGFQSRPLTLGADMTYDNTNESTFSLGRFESTSRIDYYNRYGISYRAYATNATGTGYGMWMAIPPGSEIAVEQPALAPVVKTLDATTITSNSFSPKGQVLPPSDTTIILPAVQLTERGSQVVTTHHLNYSRAFGDVSVYSFPATLTINNLSPDKDYIYRAMGANENASRERTYGYGEWKAFRTLPVSVPTVETLSTTDTALKSFVPHGKIISTNGPAATEIGFNISKSSTGSPTLGVIQQRTGTFNAGDFPTATYQAQLTNTSYYVQAYAKNSQGTGYGTWVLAKTSAPTVPVVENRAVTGVTRNSFEPHGYLKSTGGAVVDRVYFKFCPVNPDGTCSPVGSTTYTIGNYPIGDFTYLPNISVQRISSAYKYQACAKNSVGEGCASDWISLTTLGASAPAVETLPVSDQTANSMVLHAKLTDTGGATVTEIGYRLSKKIDGSSPSVIGSPKTGTFTVADFPSFPVLSGLQKPAGYTYYIQAYAKNSVGTTYGLWVPGTTTPVTKPVVKTILDATATITTTSIVPRGEITSLGGGNVQKRGFRWNTVANEVGATLTEDTIATGTYSVGPFTKLPIITGLAPATNYFIQAYAKNSAGTGYGDWLPFTTSAGIPPTVSPEAPSTVSLTFAKPECKLVSLGTDTALSDYGVYYNTAPFMSDATKLPKLFLSPTFTVGNNLVGLNTITGLTQGTEYYYQCYATNSAGTTRSGWVYFKTSALAAPVVTTLPMGTVGDVTAVANGNITSDGGSSIVERGFLFGTDADRATATLTVDTGIFVVGPYTKAPSLTGLLDNTAYWVWAYAKNANGSIGYGDPLAFTTRVRELPVVTTDPITAASNITASTMVPYGKIVSAGSSPIKIRGFNYNTSPSDNGQFTTFDDQNAPSYPFSVGPYSKAPNISGLTANTKWYYRAYATNESGWTGYGDWVTLKTTVLIPLAVTTDVIPSYYINETSATLYGMLVSTGGQTIIECGFWYGLTANDTDADKLTYTGTQCPQTNQSQFPSIPEVRLLRPLTKYYYKAYVKSNFATAVGTWESFTTAGPSLPTVETLTAADVTASTITPKGNITSIGSSTVTGRGFYWGNSENDTNKQEIHTSTAPYSAGEYSMPQGITNLNASTEYWVQAYAKNSAGTSLGKWVKVTTSAATAPVVKTLSPSSITSNSAKARGEISDTGGVPIISTQAFWKRGQTGFESSTAKGNGFTGMGTFTISNSPMGTLLTRTTYYVKTCATNSVGTSCGAWITFTAL